MSYLGKRSRFTRPYSKTPYPKRLKAANMGTVAATRGFRAYYGSRKRGPRSQASNVELKVSDIQVTTYPANLTGSFTLLHIPTLGSDYTNRIGRKTIVKSLYIRGYLAIQQALTPASSFSFGAQEARMIIFWDMQPNGAAPGATDLLNTAQPASQLNLNNRDRFRIIKDKTYTFDPWVTGTLPQIAMNHTISTMKCFKKLNGEVIFNGTNGGTIADINSGALYMFWIGSNAGAFGVSAVLSTRVRFDDQ